MHLVVVLIVSLLSIWLTVTVVKRRNGNVRFWVIMVLIFGPFALPFAFFAKPEKV